jgi:hypothetical protein
MAYMRAMDLKSQEEMLKEIGSRMCHLAFLLGSEVKQSQSKHW